MSVIFGGTQIKPATNFFANTNIRIARRKQHRRAKRDAVGVILDGGVAHLADALEDGLRGKQKEGKQL